jgi:pyridoxal phosphate enzyme (YggS family)
VTDIAARLERVRALRDEAARAAGRDPAGVRLVAVSKGQPSSAVREAYAAGQRDFGENYVQELTQKADELSELGELRWHMIGHLQRNKSKYVTRVASYVHSLDSEALAVELDKRMAAGARLPVLIEVAIAGESQKSGCAIEQLGELCAAVERCAGLELRGLMCVPPMADDPEASRPYFRELRRLRDQHGGVARLPELSMGMTADFQQAVAEGATWIRVGTAIFGARAARPPKASDSP